MKVLVIGHSGQLARELQRRSWPSDMQIAVLGRPAVDVADRASVAAAIGGHRPDAVINAAAYTGVDRAEAEPAAAFAVNRDGPRHLAEEAARHDILLLHVSTDYVFDGSGERPWREDDAPNPLGVYGRSKLAGEEAIRSAVRCHAILRTSWLFAAQGQNFVRTMLRLAGERDRIAVVDDQIGGPTPAADLAEAIAGIIEAWRAGSQAFGTFHYAAPEPVTWFDFANAIFTLAGDLVREPPEVAAITTAQFAAPAPRPRYSVLDCRKIGEAFGIVPRPWRAGLEAVLCELRMSPNGR